MGLQNSFDTTVVITKKRLEDNAERIKRALDDLAENGVKRRSIAESDKNHPIHAVLKSHISSVFHTAWSGSMLRGEGLSENISVAGKRTKMQTKFVVERESTYLNTCLAVLTE